MLIDSGCSIFNSKHPHLIKLLWLNLKYITPATLAGIVLQGFYLISLTYFNAWYDACN